MEAGDAGCQAREAGMQKAPALRRAVAGEGRRGRGRVRDHLLAADLEDAFPHVSFPADQSQPRPLEQDAYLNAFSERCGFCRHEEVILV